MSKFQKTGLDNARDELMSHIHRCGVLQAVPEQQEAWMEDTMDFMAERFPALSQEELDELRTIGMRFCSPVIPHGKENTALSLGEGAVDEEQEEQEEHEQLTGAV